MKSIARNVLLLSATFYNTTGLLVPNCITASRTRQRLCKESHLSSVLTKTDEGLAPQGHVGQDIKSSQNAVEMFFQAWNSRELDALEELFSDDCVYEDATFLRPFRGKDAVNRHFRLLADSTTSKFILDDIAVDTSKCNIGVIYHLEQEAAIKANSRHCAFFTMNAETGLITSVFDVVEPKFKNGAASLALLSIVGKILTPGKEKTNGIITPNICSIEQSEQMMQSLQSPSTTNSRGNPIERYFDAWNRRDMDMATMVFAENCQYDDTVFPSPLNGKTEVQNHLNNVANSLPMSYSFEIDAIANGGDKLGVQWHVENNGKPMPYTRGCSFYVTDKSSSKLVESAIDIVEPAVLKLGGVSRSFESVIRMISKEPQRLAPLAVWVAYMYVVFFSDGILPGANALQLEQRTWEEVRDLSLNFFLVSPLLNLPFAPTVHPMLEGVFNLLLSWAALFFGFLSDERRTKPNLIPMLPIVVGMQFLTSAFLLPYLALRTSESEQIYVEDLDNTPAAIAENKWLASILGCVGTGAIVWGILARTAEFGNWEERYTSFSQHLSMDRVGSSFLVDLAIFSVFQGWMVDDDLKRRGVADDEQMLARGVAKYVPFFGLVAYMLLRPDFPTKR